MILHQSSFKIMNRRYWVDNAKAIGIFLVFYGHLVERIYQIDKVHIAFNQFKFIYSFHIPLFFFLAGFFWKPALHYHTQTKILLSRRILPVFFFGVLFLPIWPIYQKITSGEIDWTQIIWRCQNYLYGAPFLNWTTWFLVCLFTCEMIAMISLPKCPSRRIAFIWGGGSLLIGLLISQNTWQTATVWGIPRNTWYLQESIVALGFYSTGYALFPTLCKIQKDQRHLTFFLIPISFLLLLSSFKLNNPRNDFAVLLTYSFHGDTLPFLTSSIAGIILVVSFAFILPPLKPILFIGKNTLILLGLAGFFNHFVNLHFIIKFWPGNDWLPVTSFCIFSTCLSLSICTPFIILANKYIPHLIGHPFKE